MISNNRINKIIEGKIDNGFRYAKTSDLINGAKLFGAYFSGDFAEGEVIKDTYIKFPVGTTSISSYGNNHKLKTCYSQLLIKCK